jgi:hypothetical protein
MTTASHTKKLPVEADDPAFQRIVYNAYEAAHKRGRFSAPQTVFYCETLGEYCYAPAHSDIKDYAGYRGIVTLLPPNS